MNTVIRIIKLVKDANKLKQLLLLTNPITCLTRVLLKSSSSIPKDFSKEIFYVQTMKARDSTRLISLNVPDMNVKCMCE